MIAETMTIPALVRLCGGTFLMGGADDDKFVTDTERPLHRIRLARPFALGRGPVSVAEYRRFRPDHAPQDDPRWPVVNVAWTDAMAYCRWLAETTGEAFRLPAEAEWEYACRAGSRGPFASGKELPLEGANYLHSEEGQRIGPGARTPVGSYPPNAFGLHDLHGNVCEWVADAWHPDYIGAPADGSSWENGGDPERRVIRGGAWDYLPRLLRSAWRDARPRHQHWDNVGFRIAVTVL